MSVGDRVYNVLIINCEFSTKTGQQGSQLHVRLLKLAV